MIRPCLFRVDDRLDSELSNYLDGITSDYMTVKLWAWKHLTRNPNLNDNELKSCISNNFKIKSRFANSITKDVIGTFKSNLELNKTHLKEAKIKVKSYSKYIKTKQKTVDKLREKAKNNELTEAQLIDYNQKKFKLHNMKQKLNSLNIKVLNLTDNIKNKKVSVCFGSKELFKKQYYLEDNNYTSHKEWLEDFRANRLKTIHFVGSSDETNGNQLCYIEPTDIKYVFDITIKDIKSTSEYNSILYKGKIKIKHDYNLLLDYLAKTKYRNDKYGPVTIYFRNSKQGWYGSVLIDKHKTYKSETNALYGSIGVDFNVGFISVTETDRFGNIIDSWDIPIRNNTKGNKGKSSLLGIIKNLMEYAHYKHKSVIIENLNFLRKKATLCKGFKKGYNRMLSNFNYAFYIDSMESSAKYHNVELIKVNPWNTSKAGSTYKSVLKLSTHKLAAWQIARLGMGLKLKYYKERHRHSLCPVLKDAYVLSI